MNLSPQSKRQLIIPATYLVLFKENSVLLLRRFNTGYEDGNYSFIAGHVDNDENFTQALIREALEESNIILVPEKVKVAHVMNRKVKDSFRLDVFFVANEWQGTIKNMEPHKCDKIEWFDLENLPDNVIPYIKQAIDCIKDGIFYGEFGWEM